MIDFSKAPKGTTHIDNHDNGSSPWMKLEDNEWSWWNSDRLKWWPYDYTRGQEDMRPISCASEAINVKYQGDKPTQGSERAAGYDVRAALDTTIDPGKSGKVSTTTKLQPPTGYAYFAMPRSSICNKDLLLKNSVGLIDEDYTGATIWNFYNYSDQPVTIKKGERIGQFVFFEVVKANFVNEPFTETERGDKGFGSSGVV